MWLNKGIRRPILRMWASNVTKLCFISILLIKTNSHDIFKFLVPGNNSNEITYRVVFVTLLPNTDYTLILSRWSNDVTLTELSVGRLIVFTT